MMPPMTTVASGRCTSAPAPVAIAIGTKPSDATSAVIRTGRSRLIAPSRTASATRPPLPAQPLDQRDDPQDVQRCDAAKPDEAHAGADRKRDVAQHQRGDPAR